MKNADAIIAIFDELDEKLQTIQAIEYKIKTLEIQFTVMLSERYIEKCYFCGKELRPKTVERKGNYIIIDYECKDCKKLQYTTTKFNF